MNHPRMLSPFSSIFILMLEFLSPAIAKWNDKAILYPKFYFRPFTVFAADLKTASNILHPLIHVD
jgi:hypothetical protein